MKVFEYGPNGDQASEIQDIPLPDIGTVASSFGKHDSNEFMFKFTSFTDPGSSWRVNMDTFELERVAVTLLGESCGNIDDFVTDQVFYPSKDGTMVPMFVVRRKDVLPDVNTPPSEPLLTLLYGYGGFNISITPMFSPGKLVFMNSLKGVFCVANIRGGGEYGEDWHHAGTKEKK
jgi:prolyl oligopeptidase